MKTNFIPARMGQFASQYKPRWNAHRWLHTLAGANRLRVEATATVTQQKQLPDVSFYQGFIDWDQFKTQSDAVFIRAGQALYKDVQFERNWSESKRRDIIRGSYWFYDDRADPLKQADLWATLLNASRPEMECMIDWETYYGGAYGGLKNVVKLMQRMEALGFKTGFYTGYYFFITNSNPVTNAAEYDYLKTRPLWLAWYTLDPSIVLIPKPWQDLWLWQFGTPAAGYVHGAETLNIDMNWFNGTSDAFYYYYGQTIPQPPATGAPMKYQVIGTQGLNLRNAPNTTTAQVLRLVPTNSFVWGTKDPVTGWIVGTKYQEPGGAETALAFYCSSLSTLVKEVPDTPPAQSVFVSHTFNDTMTVNGVTYTATFTVPNVEYKPNP